MKLFKKLAAIYSGSGDEEQIRKYIKRWVRSSVTDVIIEEDVEGNLYFTKGYSETYPCVVAHLDQVQDEYPVDYKVVETPDIIFGYSPFLRQRCGLGADDKCGIWIALKMLKKHDAIKVALFPGEEIGCIGSSAANMDFFSDVRFVVEPDRRGASDLITSIGFTEICSDEFIDAIRPEQFGYKETHGMMTDVEALKRNNLNVSCINLSCGYYEPHTEDEYVVKEDMLNALDFVDSIIENCTEVYPHKATKREYIDYGGSRYYTAGYDFYDGYGRSKKNGDSNDAEDEEELQRYYEQYETAEEYIGATILDDPHMTAQSFLASYGQSLDLLDVHDIQEIINLYRGMDEDDDTENYDWNKHLSNQIDKEK